MKRMPVRTVLCLGSLLGAAACGGPPANNPLLNEARSAYESAAADSQIAGLAPVALQEAQEALQQAEQVWRKKEAPAVVEHHAYIARQRVSIARETAELNAAEREVKQAETERQSVLLEARASEAERARRVAEARQQEAEQARNEAVRARQEAEQARLEAEEARSRAESLVAQLRELEAKQTERGLVLTLGDVLFDVGKANLKSGGERVAERLAAFMNQYPERNVLIEGFTDDTGSDELNQDLSRRRAEDVRSALLARGIAENRIRVRGYGEAFPIATNGTAAGRQQNRRVEVVISDERGNIPDRQN